MMKAAVLQKLAEIPKYLDFPVPIAGENLMMNVIASTVKNLDRGIASGRHYIVPKTLPTTVGVDGVGILESTGELVYAHGATGMIAEKALVAGSKYVVLDKDTDPFIAAAVPNLILGAGMALNVRAQFKAGDVVLVNGATGVTGKFAVQLAKIGGAKKVIATGRDKDTLEWMKKEFKVDETILLSDPEDVVTEKFKNLYLDTPVDIVLDYLWGKPTEMVLKGFFSAKKYHNTKIISIGEIAGSTIPFPSGVLRSSGIEILGSGFGSYPPHFIETYTKEHLCPTLALVKSGKLKIDINVIELKDIEANWAADVKGKRTVVKVK